MDDGEPFLCIVTPIFEEGFESLKLFCEQLQNQSCSDFIHVCISNGPSPLCKNLIANLDNHFIYLETPFISLLDINSLMKSLGQRRNKAFQIYNAQRYACFDVDLKIIDTDFLSVLKDNHNKADILIYRGLNPTPTSNTGYLPRLPYGKGRIDLSNFTISKDIAKKYTYPIDYNAACGLSNDWRFFSKFFPLYSTRVLDTTPIIIGGNCNYKRVTLKFKEI